MTSAETQERPPAPRVIKQMQRALDRLGLPLRVCWQPDACKTIHGELKQGTLFIYDLPEPDAWLTFQHEIIEFKLKKVTEVYQALINGLIESFEKLAYSRKEEFIESMPAVLEEIRREAAGQ